MMNILLIEDDITFASSLADVLRDLEPAIICTNVRSKVSALVALEHSEYDLIICDLSLPSVDDSLDENVAHGTFLYQHARRKHPGTPIFLLTGHGEDNIDFVTEALADAPREDLFGNHIQFALTHFIRKARLDDCITRILDFFGLLRTLDEEIEIVGMQDDLSAPERRLLRIFARRHNGALVNVSPLSGGLSASKTVRVGVQNSQLRKTANAVGKLGSFTAVDDETARYRKHIAPLLGPGSFTAYAGEVRAGTGQLAGIFYTLADEYKQSLFDVLLRSEQDAIRILDRIVQLERPWTDSSQSQYTTVENLRRVLVDDDTFTKHSALLQTRIPVGTVERTKLVVRRCSQHGDLHGLNVLVSDDNQPVLIDYGDVDIWCSCYDMLVLELSLLFHPAAQSIRGSWPSISAARSWNDINKYSIDCPFPAFIRKCREHATSLAAGPRELMANAYAFAVRQLKYPNTDKALAQSIAECAARVIVER